MWAAIDSADWLVTASGSPKSTLVLALPESLIRASGVSRNFNKSENLGNQRYPKVTFAGDGEVDLKLSN